MRSKTLLKIVLMFGLVLVMLLGMLNIDYVQAKEILFRVTNEVALPSHFAQQTCEKFKQIMDKELPPGLVKVSVYQGGQLYKDMQALDAQLLGNCELTLTHMGTMSHFQPKCGITDLPYGISTPEAVWAIPGSKLGGMLESMINASGFKVLGWMHSGTVGILTKKRVLIPQDVKGLKIRSWEPTVYPRWFELMGASGIHMPAPEVPSALQTGVIDGTVGAEVIYPTWGPIAPYFTGLGCLTSIYMFITTPKFWDGLPPNVKKVADRAIAECVPFGRDFQSRATKEMYQKHGTTDASKRGIYNLSPKEREVWKALAVRMWDDFKGVYGAELVEELKKFAAPF